MTEPTTAAAAPMEIHDPGCQCWPHVSQRGAVAAVQAVALAEYRDGKRTRAIEAEARQQNGSAHRLLKSLRFWLWNHRDLPACDPRNIDLRIAEIDAFLLAALPPSAPPALDVEAQNALDWLDEIAPTLWQQSERNVWPMKPMQTQIREAVRWLRLSLPAEARQQDGSALRLTRETLAEALHTVPAFFRHPHRSYDRCPCGDFAATILAALPPSAPPALDDCLADRKAICEAVETEWYNGNLGEDVMDRILAVRLQEQDR